MSENIRLAVEAAARAFCYESGECLCAMPGDCQMWHGLVPEVASATAAFLKAIPIKSSQREENDFSFSSRETRAKWVEAVSKVLSRETQS